MGLGLVLHSGYRTSTKISRATGKVPVWEYSARMYKRQPHLGGFAIEHDPPWSGSKNIKKPY